MRAVHVQAGARSISAICFYWPQKLQPLLLRKFYLVYIRVLPKMLTNANVLLKRCFTEKIYRPDLFQPSKGQTQRVKYIYIYISAARSTKCTYGCSVTHYRLLTKVLHTTGCSLKRYTLQAAH